MTTVIQDHKNYKQYLNTKGDTTQDEIINAKIQDELYWNEWLDEMREIELWNLNFEKDNWVKHNIRTLKRIYKKFPRELSESESIDMLERINWK